MHLAVYVVVANLQKSVMAITPYEIRVFQGYSISGPAGGQTVPMALKAGIQAISGLFRWAINYS